MITGEDRSVFIDESGGKRFGELSELCEGLAEGAEVTLDVG
jgi:hypothetical protein